VAAFELQQDSGRWFGHMAAVDDERLSYSFLSTVPHWGHILSDERQTGTLSGRWMWHNFMRLCVILGLALGAHFAMTWASARVETGGIGMRFGLLALFLLIYALLIAIPFVPGVEIGLSFMIIEGPWIAPFI
jgi:hypothetical protein